MIDTIVIDTDPGIDDALAMAFSFSVKLPIERVTTVYGKSDINNVTHNAGFIVKQLGAQWPINKGAAKPLVGEACVAKIKHQAQGHPVILAEDGIFTGSTLEFIIEHLRRERVEVAGIVAGFSFHGGQEGEVESVLGVPVEVVHGYGQLIDWVPDHDFFPFVPGCGKVLGVEMRGDHYPFYNEMGHSFGVPYLQPFAPVVKWASIPSDKVARFSARCIELTIGMFTEIGKMNNKEIQIADVLNSRQRVNIPITVDDVSGLSHGLPDAEWPIVTFLAESL